MKKGNLIYIALGLGVVYYLFTMKKSSATTTTTSNNTTSSNTTPTPPFIPAVPRYQYGLKEGDMIRSSKPDVYVMLNGLASPVTYDWIVRNQRSFNEVRVLADDIVDNYPKGDVQI
jgi:hypothetical protein